MNIYDFQLVIFDLDGVIVDTAKYHYLAWKELADRLGFEFTHEHNERLKGVSRDHSLEILLAVGGKTDVFSPEEKEKMATAKNARYVAFISNLADDELLPGVVALITDLKARGIKVALGSASNNAPIILEKTGIAPLFDVIIDGNVTSKAKPDPEVFLLSAQRLGISPADCVVFEDAQAGIDAAVAAGMAVVAVGQPEHLRGAGLYVRGLDEMFSLRNMG